MNAMAWTRQNETSPGERRADGTGGGFRRRFALLGILFFAIQAAPYAEEPSLEELPGLRERAVIMHIVSRVVEQNQQVVWNSENSKVTIPGRPVGVKLVSPDLVVAVQFTPFLRQGGRHILVAQGQIWINVPNEGVSYHTTMQTIPLEFREQVYFFPLGSMEVPDSARIEIQLAMELYSEFSAATNAANANAESPADADGTGASGANPNAGGAENEEANADSANGGGASNGGENLTPP